MCGGRFFLFLWSSEIRKLRRHSPVLPKNSELAFTPAAQPMKMADDGQQILEWRNSLLALRICSEQLHMPVPADNSACPVRHSTSCCSCPAGPLLLHPDRSIQPASRRRRQPTAAGRATDPLRRPRRAVRSLSAQHNGRVCTARRLHPSTATGARKFTDPRTSPGGLRAVIP